MQTTLSYILLCVTLITMKEQHLNIQVGITVLLHKLDVQIKYFIINESYSFLISLDMKNSQHHQHIGPAAVFYYNNLVKNLTIYIGNSERC